MNFRWPIHLTYFSLMLLLCFFFFALFRTISPKAILKNRSSAPLIKQTSRDLFFVLKSCDYVLDFGLFSLCGTECNHLNIYIYIYCKLSLFCYLATALRKLKKVLSKEIELYVRIFKVPFANHATSLTWPMYTFKKLWLIAIYCIQEYDKLAKRF